MSAEKLGYRGKRFTLPDLSREGMTYVPRGDMPLPDHVRSSRVVRDIGHPFDLRKFMDPRIPVSLGIAHGEMRDLVQPMPRVLDIPIKMAGYPEFRVPREFSPIFELLAYLAAFEASVNPDWGDYYAYLTVDQRAVAAGTQLREAPCHVDGFQGNRWVPKHPGNHSYTIANVLPTWFYPMPFDFSELDIGKHDVFWEMNYQVAQANSAVRWSPKPWEITLMDCYCVHRGREAIVDTPRSWLRLSFETRVFNRLGNAHNPMFDYAWDMQPRDIEELELVAFHGDCDPSLRVFPWQGLDGLPLEAGEPKTKPNLMPLGPGVIPDAWRDYEIPFN